MASTKITVKAMVDKEKSKVMFIEAGSDFVDVLFGFLTMPMGGIMNVTHDCPPRAGISCMNNLYKSVESLNENYFPTRECKSMLVQPQNAAADQFNSLKVMICDYYQHCYICSDLSCLLRQNVLSRYAGVSCGCGALMTRELIPDEIKSKDNARIEDEAVFLKDTARFLITDDLQIILMSKTSTLSLLSRFEVANYDGIEEITIGLGVKEVVNLLKHSLASKNPLTETFLFKVVNLPKHSLALENRLTKTLVKLETKPKLIKGDRCHGTRHVHEELKSGDGTVYIRLIVSKSKKVVCYADATEGFVDLLFGFLTVPLGHIFREMRGEPLKRCAAFNLYKSAEDLDAAEYLKSDEHKDMLLRPKLAPFSGSEKQLLIVEEAPNKKYYWSVSSTGPKLTTRIVVNEIRRKELTVMDPKSPLKKQTKGGGGFVKAPATFTVTDNLTIAPVFSLLCLSTLNKMEVDPEDVEEYVVPVGKTQASELLIAAFTSQTPLTDVFLRNKKKKV